jgi:hypothetical protein
MDGVQSYKSHIDPAFDVLIIYPESSLYETVGSYFKTAGHAFLIHDKKMIVVDGTVIEEPWFSKDHLMVIEAHEVGHHIAGHSIDSSAIPGPDMEKEADWIGHRILKEAGHHSASRLHRDEYKARYGIFPEREGKMRHLIKRMQKNKHICAN